MHRIALLLTVSLLLPLAHLHAQARVLVKDDRVTLLGGKSSTFSELPIRALAGETITIIIGEGRDDVGDGGVTWRLEDVNGRVLSKGFSKEIKKVSWSVKLTASNPTLIVEDKDTNTAKDPKKRGNGVTIGIVASPPAKPAPPKGNNNYFGGPKVWYDSGLQMGKADRKARKNPDVNRHKDHFDNITAGEFKRGYLDAFK